jgi:uncharacterized phage-like protein YoqJ
MNMGSENNQHNCCFIGHRKIQETDRLKAVLYKTIKDLIVNNKVCNFLFGSRSEFDSLCLEIVSDLKREYPYINRIYVRAEYPYIENDYIAYLLKSYDDTYYPENIKNSGKAAYIERNFEMIRRSNYCIFYYDETYTPQICQNSKSGTKISYDYALKSTKNVINTKYRNKYKKIFDDHNI